MDTDSTRDDAFGVSKRDKIAEEWVADVMQHPDGIHDLLMNIARDGFDGFRHMKEQEVFRHGMMLGVFEE